MGKYPVQYGPVFRDCPVADLATADTMSSSPRHVGPNVSHPHPVYGKVARAIGPIGSEGLQGVAVRPLSATGERGKNIALELIEQLRPT